jgi:hypothetical protein
MVLIFGKPFKLPELMRSAGWLVARALGLAREGNWATTDFAFDVLSLQALFLVYLASRIQLTLGAQSILFSGFVAILWTAIAE